MSLPTDSLGCSFWLKTPEHVLFEVFEPSVLFLELLGEIDWSIAPKRETPYPKQPLSLRKLQAHAFVNYVALSFSSLFRISWTTTFESRGMHLPLPLRCIY